jgi:hypothetical protein
VSHPVNAVEDQRDSAGNNEVYRPVCQRAEGVGEVTRVDLVWNRFFQSMIAIRCYPRLYLTSYGSAVWQMLEPKRLQSGLFW